ncbi:pseudouridine synthase [Idiomarina xiamenensis]|uniref:Dual-specificity RNA pseudouridine synthase RluA n=1 Tax=Idiomarina xiamenensis 10-D-4 TaxID=740709 RepID=K2KHL7_9GAMM|nr:pseudouridine synthase [Idiomarina xiamenensis]EKE87483.1 pseudouridylate synthase [Idiomarina xiamenensis 10-D-4]
MTLFHYQPPTSPYLTILYRDEQLLVVDKPSGLLSVPGKDPAHADSVYTRVSRVLPDARVVHRLDMATSGIMLLTLGKAAQSHVARQFQQRQVSKLYTAEVWGKPPADSGFIDLAMRCDWPNRPRQMLDLVAGKSAQTLYRVIAKTAAQRYRLQLSPYTGRSHQLRVHMQALGCAIVGDKFYACADGYAAAPRLHLHATELHLHHPRSEQPISFYCPPPF